jgi:uncharacterized protein (DUF924 family)
MRENRKSGFRKEHWMKTPQDVFAFWLGEPAKDLEELKTKAKRWFGGGAFDDEIRREFGSEVDAAIEGKLDAWLAAPKGWLALLIMLDQFTRNIFRGEVRSYAGDARALKLATEALDNGTLRALATEERTFALMPLLHAEDLSLQARYREEVLALAKSVPPPFNIIYGAALHPADKYADIIRRFGRFPHRNKILGRVSTPEEETYLSEHPDPMGQ